MRKIKVGTEEVEFLEEEDVTSLFEDVSQIAQEKGVSEKMVSRAKKAVLKQTKKMQKASRKGKIRTADPLLALRQSTRDLEAIVKDPSSYAPNVVEELLKSV